MTQINRDDVTRLGELARIGIPQDAAAALAPELTQILDHVEQLQTVDIAQVEPTAQVTGLCDVWREDEVREEPWSRELLLQNAPQTRDGYIQVPRVL